MPEHVSQAQVKPTPVCDQCSKPFSTKAALTRHVKIIHDGIVSLKNMFSTPKALNPQKRLFASVPNLSVQGNSAGQVNDPEVMSEGSFICGICDKRFTEEGEMKNHKDDAHDKATTAASVDESDEGDNANESDMLDAGDDQALIDAMEEVQEEADIFEALETLTQSDFDAETDKENKQKLKEKLYRYRTIMMKKTELQKQTGEKVKQLKQELVYMKHDASLHDEVVENAKITLDEKDKEITDMGKQLKKTREKYNKDKQEYKNSLHKLQQDNGKFNKEKQDLKFGIQNHKAMIMSLKEKLEDVEVLEDTEEPEEEAEIQVTACVDITKDVSGNKCTACDKVFNKN